MSTEDGLPEGEWRDCDGFGAPASVPGQEESRTARAELDEWLKQREKAVAWKGLWEELQGERAAVFGPDGELALNERGEARVRQRWNWRKALYIAWCCVPKVQREPATLEELAKLLGLKSASAFRNWRRRDPEIDEQVRSLPRRLLVQHLADVYAAHVSVATLPDPKATAERRLFFEMIGELEQSRTTAVAVATGGQVSADVVGLTDAELEVIAAGRISRGSGRGAVAQAEGA